MNRFLLLFLALCFGWCGFFAIRPATKQVRAEAIRTEQQWDADRNELGQAQNTLASLRDEVASKKHQLQSAMRQPEFSPALLTLLEGNLSAGSPTAWAELREQLGIGWNRSDDYVLVSKRVLKHLDYSKFLSASSASDTTRELLALTPSEQASIREVLQSVREGQWLTMERGEPGGEVVAQYTVPMPDLSFEQASSNNFAAGITAAIGPERAGMLFPAAWREFRYDLSPTEAQTMTIRRTMSDGQPDLVCEMKSGARLDTMPVRYAHYPSMWFLSMFPGGWQTLADREGFELPALFRK